MEKSYEEIYSTVEERHPWFVARRELFSLLAGEDPTSRVLDIGCGTGMFLVHLKAIGFENLAGVETSATQRARFRDPTIEVFEALPEARYDKIFMLDVLEHIEDDRGALAEVYRRLDFGGCLLASVPAHPYLWSHHDEVNQHQRRYRRTEFKEKLITAGFQLRRLSYWNMFSFPAICVARWLALGQASSDLRVGSPLTLGIYHLLLRLENRILMRLALPIGVSLVAVATKPRS